MMLIKVFIIIIFKKIQYYNILYCDDSSVTVIDV